MAGGNDATERATAESMREHWERTRHSVTGGLNQPWRCLDCPARSPLWEAKNVKR